MTDKHSAQIKKYDQTVSVNGKILPRLSTGIFASPICGFGGVVMLC